jgi:Icc-related predicted phosphoesterase
MELLLFGDAHIKPVDESVDWAQLTVPSDVDIVLSLGDVIHDAREDALDCGRQFFEQLASHDVPIVAVPRNHDPVEYYPELLGSVSSVVNVHHSVLSTDEFPQLSTSVEPLSFVGWGCEQFNQEPEIRPNEFPSLSPAAGNGSSRYEADQLAQQLEDELYRYLTTNMTDREFLSSLDIAESNQREFLQQLDQTTEVYSELSSLLEQTEYPTVVLSHVPPYNTEADRHYSIGQREMGLEGAHVGSIGLKLALRDYRPLAAFHGHSHNPVYNPGFGDETTPHSLNPGFQGIVRVSINGRTGMFSYQRLTDGQ